MQHLIICARKGHGGNENKGKKQRTDRNLNNQVRKTS